MGDQVASIAEPHSIGRAELDRPTGRTTQDLEKAFEDSILAAL
jgi:hypothetical protein